MTSNEKKVLTKFKEIKQGNTVTMAGTLRVTINYAYDVCKKLCEKGYLERLSPGRFALYKITPSGEEQVKGEGEGDKELESVVGVEEEGKEATERPKGVLSEANVQSEGVPPRNEASPKGGDSESGTIQEKEEYECSNCGTAVREEEIECPKCGIIFEGFEEEPEEEMAEGEPSLQSGASDVLKERSEKVPQPTPQSPEGNKGSVVEGNDNAGGKTEILDHPSVPEDWKTCNWKWK